MGLKRSEILAAIWMGLGAFFLFIGYEIFRSPSTTLVNTHLGVAKLPLVNGLMPLGVLFLVYLYARTLSILGPRKTLLVTSLVFSAVIFVGYGLIEQGFGIMAGFLYIFREAYIMVIIEQVWSFLNSTLGENSAKKLNGPICGMGSCGGLVGGLLGGSLVSHYGTTAMLIVSGLSLLPFALFSAVAYQVCEEPRPSQAEMGGKKGQLGLHVFRENRILVYLLGVVIASQVVSGMTTLHFQTALQEYLPVPDLQTAYSYRFYSWLNAASLFLQFIVAPVLLQFVSLSVVFWMIPVVQLVAAIFNLTMPSLFLAGMGLLVFKAFDYSLFRVVKETFFIPLSFDARYRAKQIIDVFGYRTSKGVASMVIYGVRSLTQVGTGIFPAVVAGASLIWLATAIPLTREAEKSKKGTHS